MIIILQVTSGSEPAVSSLGALQFAAVGLESVNYGHLQQHLQRQVLFASVSHLSCSVHGFCLF